MKNKIIGLIFLWVTCPGIAIERPLPQGFSFTVGALPQIHFAQGIPLGIGFFAQPGYQINNFIFSLEFMHINPQINYKYTYVGINIAYSMFLPMLGSYVNPALAAKAGDVFETDPDNSSDDIRNKTGLALSLSVGLVYPLDQDIALLMEPAFMYHQSAMSNRDGTVDRSNAMIKLGLRYSMDDLMPIAY